MIVIEIEVEEAMISTEKETAIRDVPAVEASTDIKRNLKV